MESFSAETEESAEPTTAFAEESAEAWSAAAEERAEFTREVAEASAAISSELAEASAYPTIDVAQATAEPKRAVAEPPAGSAMAVTIAFPEAARSSGDDSTDFSAGGVHALDEEAQVVAEDIAELPSASAKETAEFTRSMAKEIAGAANAAADATTLALAGMTKAREDVEPEVVLALQYMRLPSGRWTKLFEVAREGGDGESNFAILVIWAVADVEARDSQLFVFGRLCTTM